MPLFRGIGKQIQIGISKESTRGTANTTGTVYWLAVSDYSLDERYTNAVDQEVYGVIEDSVSETRVKNWTEGSLPLPIADKSFGLMLLSLFGTDSPLQRPADLTVYDHRFSVAQTVQHQSLTVLVHDPIPAIAGTASDYSVANSVVSKMDIEYQLGAFIKTTVGIKGLKGVKPSTGNFSVTQTAENRFVPQYVSFRIGNNPAAASATTAIALRSLKLSFDPNTEDDDVIGSTSPRDFLNKEFKCEGEFEAIWKDQGEFQVAALANNTQSLVISMANTDVTIGTAANPTVSFLFPDVSLTEFSKPIRIRDVVYQNVKFKAHYNLNLGYMVKATVTNVVAAY